MASVEFALKKEDVSKLKKDISTEEAKNIIEEMSIKFNMNIMELVQKVAKKEADGFSLNKNSPYMHLYIGNGSDKVSIELTTSGKETKIKFPKSLFL